MSRPGVGWQLRIACKIFPKKYLGSLVCALWGKTSLPVSTLGSRARLAKPSMVQSRLLKPIGRQQRTVLSVSLGYFTDTGGGFVEVGRLHWWGPPGSQPQRSNTCKLGLGRNPGHHFEAAWSPEMSEVCGQHRFALYNLLDHPRHPQPLCSCVRVVHALPAL